MAQPVHSNARYHTLKVEHRRETRLARGVKAMQLVVLGGIVILGLVYFFERIQTVTTIIIGSLFLFYAIYPAVKRLHQRLPLWASILVVYLVLIAVVSGALAYFVPEVSNNVRQFSHDLPTITNRIQSIFSNPNQPLLHRLPAPVKDLILGLPARLSGAFHGNTGEVTKNALHTVVSVVTFIAIFIIVPIATIYMMMDTGRFRRAFLNLIPPQSRPKTIEVLSEMHDVVGGYIRGQLLVAVIVGILMTALLSGLRVPYAAALGMFGGLLEIIPYAGAIVGGAIAAIAALLSNGPLNAGFVVLGLIVINQLEGHVLAPFVVGESVKLRPLTILLALLTGAELFGILGMLVAVPVVGIIKVLITNFLAEPDAAPPRTSGRARKDDV